MIRINNKIRDKLLRIGPIAILILFSIYQFFYIFYNASFSFGDESQFLTTTAINKILPLKNYIMPSIGRFFPLGLMDYNLLIILPHGDSPYAHFLLNSISFIILVVTSFIYYKKIIIETIKPSIYLNIIIIACVSFITTRFYSVFLSLIFPERIIITLISLFLLLHLKYTSSKKAIYGFLSIVVAVYLTYCKEPIFGSLFVFSSVILIFNWEKLSLKNRAFYLVLITNSLIFIVIYYFIVFKHLTTMYSGGNMQMEFVDLFYKVFRSHKILLLALILSIYRLYKILLKRDYQFAYYDALLFTGMSYTIAILFLGLNFSYYYFPAVMFCTPPLVFWSLELLHTKYFIALWMLASIYTSSKVVDDIQKNQQGRANFPIYISQISGLIEQGYSPLWVQPELNNDFNISIRQWRKESLETYLNYLITPEKISSFTIIESPLEVNVKKKTILFFPLENIESDFNELKIDSFSKQNNFTLLTEIGGIKSYIN
jgi:hypothetical protein